MDGWMDACMHVCMYAYLHVCPYVYMHVRTVSAYISVDGCLFVVCYVMNVVMLHVFF